MDLREKTYFEQQREALISDIAMVGAIPQHDSGAEEKANGPELRTRPRKHQ